MKVKQLGSNCFLNKPKLQMSVVLNNLKFRGFNAPLFYSKDKNTPMEENEYSKIVGLQLFENGFVLSNCLIVDLSQKNEALDYVFLEEFTARRAFKLFLKKLFKSN